MALKEALTAYEEDEVPVGAVIVSGHDVLAKSHNTTERLRDVSAHAEMLAITAAAQHLGGKYLNDCTLYVTLEPCAMCAAALAHAQIKRIVFGAKDQKKGFSQYQPSLLHPKTKVNSGILADECSQLLSRFFLSKRMK